MAFFASKVTLFQLSPSGSSWISLGSSGYLVMARNPNPDHPDTSGQHIHYNISDTLNSDAYCRFNKLDYTTIEIMWWDIALLSRNKHLHYSIKYGFKEKGDSAVVTKAFNLKTQKIEIIAIRFGSNDRDRICQRFRTTFWNILEDLCEDKKTLYPPEDALSYWSCAACDHSRNHYLDNRCSRCNAVRPSPFHIIRDHVMEYDEDRYDFNDLFEEKEEKESKEKKEKKEMKNQKKKKKGKKMKYDPFDDEGSVDSEEEDEEGSADGVGDGNELILRYDWECPACHHVHDKQWKNKKLNRCDVCSYACPFIMDQCQFCMQFLYLGHKE